MNHSLNTTDFNEQILRWVNFYVNDILGSIIFILGLIFNILSFAYFQMSRSFRDTSMRHYFSALSITDSIRLSEWLFQYLLNKKVIVLSKSVCNGYMFLIITSGQISVWLLVFLSIERFIILQFPFKGKQFYTTRNSLKMLCVVVIIFLIFDIPYLLPDFFKNVYSNYEYKIHMCINDEKFRVYMFVNNILIYILIPFSILLFFNCLLIALLSRRNSQLVNMIQNENACVNAKRERQLRERTILLISVTFFLVITLSPRYIGMIVFIISKNTQLLKVAISKSLNVLEMLNFGVNFLFYIICCKTSRKEFYLIIYYFFYWRWSEKSKKYTICNHPNHNKKHNGLNISNSKYIHGSSTLNTSTNIIANEYEPMSFNVYNIGKKSKFRIHCFLSNANRLKNLENRRLSLMANNNLVNNNDDYLREFSKDKTINKTNLSAIKSDYKTKKKSSRLNKSNKNKSNNVQRPKNIKFSNNYSKYPLRKGSYSEKEISDSYLNITPSRGNKRFFRLAFNQKNTDLN